MLSAIDNINGYLAYFALHRIMEIVVVPSSVKKKKKKALGAVLQPFGIFISSPKCGTLTWWGGLSGLIKY